MSDACPAPSADDPLVQSLLGVVDCNVQAMVQGGYASLFQQNGVFVSVLTAGLTIYVALLGYQLLLGRAPLNVTDLTLSVVKLGAVLAVATQWGSYQTLIYHALFYGPEQVADVILRGFRARASGFQGDVFEGLQRAFTDLTSFSPATPPGAPSLAAPIGASPTNPGGAAGSGVLSTLLSKAGFDSLLLLLSAVVLVVSSLGVLLASKIVLGILLATGPIFIALLLFQPTRGLFEGWLRASLAFAFAPLAVTLMLGVALTMLDPSLDAVEAMRQSNTYTPGVAFGVMVLVVVFAGVALGLVAAGGVIAAGFKLPSPSRAARDRSERGRRPDAPLPDAVARTRAARTASAVAALARRDASPGPAAAAVRGAASDRRTSVSTTVRSETRSPAPELRLGQSLRRSSGPRAQKRAARGEP